MTNTPDSPAQGAPLPDILGLLPHRYPFLLVDRITALVPGRHAEGIKQISVGEWLIGLAPPGAGMPGGLVVEALAQLSGAVLAGLTDGTEGTIGYFMAMDRVRYRGEARAGDELRLSVDLLRARAGICRLRGEARVNGRRIVRAELTIVLRAAERPTRSER